MAYNKGFTQQVEDVEEAFAEASRANFDNRHTSPNDEALQRAQNKGIFESMGFGGSLESVLKPEDVESMMKGIDSTLRGIKGFKAYHVADDLMLDVIAITYRSESGVVFCHLTLLEAGLSKPIENEYIPYEYTENNLRVKTEVINVRTTAMCYSEDMRATVTAHINNVEGGKPAEINYLTPFTLPTTMVLSEPIVARIILSSAVMAIQTHCGMLAENILRLAFKQPDGSRPDYALDQVTELTPGATSKNIVGLPLAQDFITTLTMYPSVRNKSDDNEGRYVVRKQDNSRIISKVTGLVDFVPDGRDKNEEKDEQGRYKGYIPRFLPIIVATSNETVDAGGNLEGPKQKLTGLATLAEMASNQAWVRVFENLDPKRSKKASIGTLGIAAYPYSEGDEELKKWPVVSLDHRTKSTKDDAYTPIQFANVWVEKDPIIAMDITLGSRTAWADTMFLAAAGLAAGDVTTRDGNDAIIRTCNEMTDDLFSSIWNKFTGKRDAAVVSDRTIQIQTGYFTDPSGSERDIRSIDYLDVLSTLDKDLEMVNKAVANQTPGLSDDVTYADREAILKNILEGSSYKQTGKTFRIITMPGFIPCLAEALNQAGLRINPKSDHGYSERGNYHGISEDFGNTFAGGRLYNTPRGRGNAGVSGNDYSVLLGDY